MRRDPPDRHRRQRALLLLSGLSASGLATQSVVLTRAYLPPVHA